MTKGHTILTTVAVKIIYVGFHTVNNCSYKRLENWDMKKTGADK